MKAFRDIGVTINMEMPQLVTHQEWMRIMNGLKVFILLAGTLITLSAAAGALTLAPILTRKLGRRLTIDIGVESSQALGME